MTTISIVTCTWNSEATLRDTIASVDQQTYKHAEVIYVDGGSVDATLDLIGTTKTPHRVQHNVTGGIARAMNTGITAATGDVVCHLHSDDYFLHPHVLERVAEVFERTGCEWLFGRILNDRDGGLFPEPYIPPAYSYAALIKANIVPHPATFVRRSLYERAGGFSESLRFAMDYDMWLRLGKMAEPVALREALSVFRRHEGSTTEKHRIASLREDYEVRSRYLSSTVQRLEHALRFRRRLHVMKSALARVVQ